MTENTYNGFASEEQYEAVKEMVESIIYYNKEFPYDTLGIYGDEEHIEVMIDDYYLLLYSGIGCEIQRVEEKRIHWDIVDIAADLANSMRNGDFDFVFNPEVYDKNNR